MDHCIDTKACIGRREFLVKAGLVAGGVVLTVSAAGRALGASAFEDLTVSIGADSPLAKVGGSQVVASTAGKIIIIRTGETKFAAFSAHCTHKRGLLSYDSEKNQLSCPNHGSKFDAADGSVRNGPAEKPLPSYNAQGSADSVTISVG